MRPFPRAGALEKVAGNPVVEATLTFVAATIGGPLAPVIPVLTKSLASERQKVRIEAFLVDVEHTLNSFEDRLRDLSDAQYKLLNESILAALNTTEQEKLRLLRSCVKNSLDMPDVDPMEAVALSRIIHDISVEEALFVVRNFSYQCVTISSSGAPSKEDATILCISPGSREEMVVSGLTTLGLLMTGEPTLGQLLRWSRLVAKFIVLLRDTK